jgi:FkbM family methyltransferase
MLNPLQFFSKPEYFWRPPQVLRRFRRMWHSQPPEDTVTLPWGLPLRVRTRENIGSDIYHYGIFDKIVPETIMRLLDPGEGAVEVGANIGQNCSLMATRVGTHGHVLAFEPHPEIFEELKRNASHWKKRQMGELRLEKVALGDHEGTARLVNGADFNHNRGSASLTGSGSEAEGFTVPIRRLDDYLKEFPMVGVCKIDVEGHELAVLEGARESLTRRSIRDIIFEDFDDQPSCVTQFLRQYGFNVFALVGNWLKPRLLPAEAARKNGRSFSYNFLATLEPNRARARFRVPGWRILLNF